MTQKKIYIIVYKVFLIALAVVFIVLYRQQKQSVENKCIIAFDSTIASELNQRVKEMPFHYFPSVRNTNMDTCNHFIVKDQTGITVHKKTEKQNSLSVSEKMEMLQQTTLLTHNPLNLSVLDSIFRNKLSEYQIVINTCVSYSLNNEEKDVYSQVTSFDKKAAFMIERHFGISDEITLRGLALIPFGLILRQIIPWIIGIALVVVLITIWLFYKLLHKKYTVLRFDKTSLTIQYGDKTIQLTKELFRLFEFIFNKELHQATYEDIIVNLYEKNLSAEIGKTRIAQSIKLLRSRMLPEFQDKVIIENIPGSGYKIVITD